MKRAHASQPSSEGSHQNPFLFCSQYPYSHCITIVTEWEFLSLEMFERGVEFQTFLCIGKFS